MLKNKKALYILLPVNILVWGFFVYRFLSLYEGGPEMAPITNSALVETETASDTIKYVLSLNYKDPFLKDVKLSKPFSTGQAVQSLPQPKPKPVPAPEPVKKVTPDIKYLGMIKNSDKGVSTALVSFNGRPLLVKPNDVVEGIAFKQFNKDSLLAKCGKENIVVRR